jgi:hypothetical protein
MFFPIRKEPDVQPFVSEASQHLPNCPDRPEPTRIAPVELHA